MTFARKAITVTITLGQGQYGTQAGVNSVVLEGYRVLANMSVYFGLTQGSLQCRIYGLSTDLMNKLTTIGPINNQIRSQNSISIAAGDYGQVLTTVFTGTIDTAFIDLQNAPDASLSIIGYSAQSAAIVPVGAYSAKGPTSISTIMNGIIGIYNATSSGPALEFINHGVTSVITDPYISGSTLDRIRKASQAARCSYSIEQNLLSIWNTGNYTNDPVITLTPKTGMVGYPAFSSQGVGIKNLFIPGIKQGQQVIISGSTLDNANGSWIAQNIIHNLESEKPGGAWFTQFIGTRSINGN